MFGVSERSKSPDFTWVRCNRFLIHFQLNPSTAEVWSIACFRSQDLHQRNFAQLITQPLRNFVYTYSNIEYLTTLSWWKKEFLQKYEAQPCSDCWWMTNYAERELCSSYKMLQPRAGSGVLQGCQRPSRSCYYRLFTKVIFSSKLVM